MRALSAISAAAVAALAAGTALAPAVAFAADATGTEPVPQAAIPMSAPANADWTGGYAGGRVGYDFGTSGVSNLNTSGSKANHSRNAFTGGVYGGYMQQVAPNIAVGGEADLGVNENGKTATFNGQTVRTKERYDASLRGRAGYTNGSWMVYGLAGPAMAGGTAEFNGGSAEKTHVGYVVGAGVENQFSPNLVGRLEYTYADYGSKDYSIAGQTNKIGLKGQTVSAGLAYKF